MAGRLARVLGLLALSAGMILAPLQPTVLALDEEDALREEANRLTYEIIELRNLRNEAEAKYAGLQAELQELDGALAAAAGEVEVLERELTACREAYDYAVRSLYKRGEIGELEIILEAGELDEMWSDTAVYDRIIASEVRTREALEEKIAELDLRRRDLREMSSKRERTAQALDPEGLEGRIAGLEARLSEINGQLRSLEKGDVKPGRPAAEPAPVPWTVPPPGKLLDRVPTMPPLSDFERTGMVHSGYTTYYGEEFDGTSTASGVIFHMHDYTCAHRTLPFGTWLLVTFQGRQVIVQVNDRGPFVPGRVLDLSYGAAQSIGLNGVQWTEFEILTPRGG